MTRNADPKLIAPTLAMVSLGLVALAQAGGFFGGLHDVWGARYSYWVFDKTEGFSQGRNVADYVLANAFVPSSY